METYNYDAAAVPEGDADTTPAAAPETDAQQLEPVIRHSLDLVLSLLLS